MKIVKFLAPILIIIVIISIDYYNSNYKENTSFSEDSIFLYVIKDDSLRFADSISKYVKMRYHMDLLIYLTMIILIEEHA